MQVSQLGAGWKTAAGASDMSDAWNSAAATMRSLFSPPGVPARAGSGERPRNSRWAPILARDGRTTTSTPFRTRILYKFQVPRALLGCGWHDRRWGRGHGGNTTSARHRTQARGRAAKARLERAQQRLEVAHRGPSPGGTPSPRSCRGWPCPAACGRGRGRSPGIGLRNKEAARC